MGWAGKNWFILKQIWEQMGFRYEILMLPNSNSGDKTYPVSLLAKQKVPAL